MPGQHAHRDAFVVGVEIVSPVLRGGRGECDSFLEFRLGQWGPDCRLGLAGALACGGSIDTPGPWRRANVDSPVGVAELAVGQLLTDCTESTIQPFASVPWSVRRAVLPGNE